MSFEIKLPGVADAVPTPSASSSRGSHQLMAASGCDRYYALKYIAGLRIQHEPPYRLIGTLIHEGLASHYASMLDPAPSWYDPNSFETILRCHEAEGSMQAKTAREVVNFYKHNTAGDNWKPLFVEEEFSASLGELDPTGPHPELNDARITCRTDLVVQANGETWIVDHKCSGGGWNADRLDRWQDDGEYKLSFQVMVNLLLLRLRLPERGIAPPKGFIIQRIKRKAPFDFDRNVVSVPALAYATAGKTARHLVRREQEIRGLVQIGQKPAPNYAHCYGRYGKCEYHGICSAESELQQQQIIATDFVRTA